MTTTTTYSKTLSAEMSQITGMHSICFKIVSILFIIVLNASTASSQINQVSYSKYPVLQSSVQQQQKQQSTPEPLCGMPYTIYLVQSFPIIECQSGQALHAMDDFERFDYEALFCSTLPKKVSGPKPMSIEYSTPPKKVKTRIASKLNS